MGKKSNISRLASISVTISVVIIVLGIGLVILLDQEKILQTPTTEKQKEPTQQITGFCGNVNSSESTNPIGHETFMNNCASCHHLMKRVTGPALFGAIERFGSKEKLIAFITNRDSLIDMKDEYTLQILSFDESNCTSHLGVYTKEEIESLLLYITP